MNLIQAGDTVLFTGDSITDCGRGREHDSDLGRGYANFAAALYQAQYPAAGVRFLNRGVSGARVRDLQGYWQADCLELKPQVVSLLIGINDTWRRYDRDDPTPVADFRRGYRELLERVRDELGARLVILEPFVLPMPPDRASWREDLDPKIHVARDLACEFGAVYVPLDGLFAAAATRRPPAFWAQDGVHPTQAGHALIANAWLQAVGAAG